MAKAKLPESQSPSEQDASPGNVVDYRVQSVCQRKYLLLWQVLVYSLVTQARPLGLATAIGRIKGDEWEAYKGLERTTRTNHGIPYGGRPLWERSRRSSQRPGKPATGRRAAGVWKYRAAKVRDAQAMRSWPFRAVDMGKAKHWRAGCGEILHVRFGKGPLEKGRKLPRRGPTSRKYSLFAAIILF